MFDDYFELNMMEIRFENVDRILRSGLFYFNLT